MAAAVLSGGLLPTSAAGQATSAPVHAPLFASVWIGGPLDSMYNAEYARLQAACPASDARCFEQELDTTSVVLTPAWPAPGAPEPAGHLVAALRARGRYPHATLLYRPTDGPEVTLREDLGDWGYGVTLALADTVAGWIRPIFVEVDVDLWIPAEGASPGFGAMEIYGLEGRLWRLGPVAATRQSDGVRAELSRGVYFFLEVSGGAASLRPETASDMPCGEEGADRREQVPVYTVPLDRLVGVDGLPVVEPAYPKGC